MNNLKYKWYKLKYNNLNRGNVIEFNLVGKTRYCKVVDIIDAQKCMIIMDMFGDTYKWTLRLDGYKTHILSDIIKLSEHHNKILLSSQSARAYDFFGKLIKASTKNIFKLHITGFDKVGNLLGYLYYPKHSYSDSISLNELMIINGYGVECNNLYNTQIHQ
jgi:hypothetical protein